MSIVILAWGSLAYDWHRLSLAELVRWRLVGPKIPIQFSRRSKTGERKGILTAVIDTTCGEVVPTRISESELKSVAEVRAELRIREGETRLSWIASIDREGRRRGECPDSVFDTVYQWLLTTKHNAAVWTAIPADFGGEAFSWTLGVTAVRW